MKTIIINDENIDEQITKKKLKSRAVLVNSSNEILVANYGGVFLLPGGSIDGKETPDETIHRELREELGVDMKSEQLKPFVKVRYFQPNYPERNGNTINRLAVTYYYLGHINNISNERDLTENEKKDGFTVEFYSINQIQGMLNSKKGNNPRRLYFDRELQAVIDYYKERLQVREDIEIMK